MSANKQLRHVLAVQSDGDEALIQALFHNFPFAQQLQCFYYFEKNIHEKLWSLAIPSKIIDEFIHDIFGHRHGQTMEGLVDCISSADFDSKLDSLEAICEYPYCGEGGPQFLPVYQAIQSSSCYTQQAREAIGLGSPPAPYTTNASESVDAVIKQHV